MKFSFRKSEDQKKFEAEIKQIERDAYQKALAEEREVAKAAAKEKAYLRGKAKAHAAANRPSLGKAFVIGAKKTAKDINRVTAQFNDAQGGFKKAASYFPNPNIIQTPKKVDIPFASSAEFINEKNTKKMGEDMLNMAGDATHLKKPPRGNPEGF